MRRIVCGLVLALGGVLVGLPAATAEVQPPPTRTDPSVAAATALVPDGGYVLDGFGGLHAFGGAPGVRPGSYWPGWDIARGVVTRPDNASGYVLDGWGGVHAFGGAPAVPPRILRMCCTISAPTSRRSAPRARPR